jgi:hypothetical protein
VRPVCAPATFVGAAEIAHGSVVDEYLSACTLIRHLIEPPDYERGIELLAAVVAMLTRMITRPTRHLDGVARAGRSALRRGTIA